MAKKQLLIESAQFISKVKVSKELKESLEMTNGKSGTLIVRNIPCTLLDRENQNGRIYSTEVLQEAINNAKSLFEQKQLLSQADEHPESSFVAPTHASHVVINAYIKPNVLLEVDGEQERDNVLFMDWEVLNTEEGKNLRALFEAECSIGTSIRGLGDMHGSYVENYDLLGCDCVGNPSSSTYSRMPIHESIKLELKPTNELKETFNVASSSTTTTRDLDQAEKLILNAQDINYGTVVKTQTKFEQENDPKTGAETTITHVEIETSDDEEDLDRALQRAKNALLNPVVSMDSVTIEHIKDPDKKETVTYEPERSLKEEDPKEEIPAENVAADDEDEKYVEIPEDYVPTKDDVDYEYVSGIDDDLVNTFIEKWNTYTDGEKQTLMQYVFRKNKLKKESADENDPYYLALKKTGYYDFDDPAKYMEYINQNSDKLREDELKDAEEVYTKYTNGEITKELACHELQNINNGISLRTPFELSDSVKKQVKEAKEEDPRKGEKFVLKAPNGFVSMEGNALVFQDDPKKALHFIVGKENTGLVHLSEVEKILDTMGVYETEKLYRVVKKNEPEAEEDKKEGLIGTDINVNTGDILSGNKIDASLTDSKGDKKEGLFSPDINITTGDIGSGNSLDASLLPESGELKEDTPNTKYTAEVMIDNANGSKVENIPVSAVEMDSVISEVANLYDMKSKKEPNVKITVTDTQANQKFVFNPESRALDPIDDVASVAQPTQESSDRIEQNGDKLEIDIDDNNHVEKEFDNPVQASIAKAGIEQGKINPDVMLSEEEKMNEGIIGSTLGAIAGALVGRTSQGRQMGNDMEDNGILHDSTNVQEKLYSEPTEPSDELVEGETVTIVLSNIDYDIDSLDNANIDASPEELVSLVSELPNDVKVQLDKSLEDEPNLLDIILQKAKEQTGLPIRNATVVDVL